MGESSQAVPSPRLASEANSLLTSSSLLGWSHVHSHSLPWPCQSLQLTGRAGNPRHQEQQWFEDPRPLMAAFLGPELPGWLPQASAASSGRVLCYQSTHLDCEPRGSARVLLLFAANPTGIPFPQLSCCPLDPGHVCKSCLPCSQASQVAPALGFNYRLLCLVCEDFSPSRLQGICQAASALPQV